MNRNGRFQRVLSSIGPGLVCLGFTIGTGSVTSMVTSGSKFGTALLWVLALSAFFNWVLTYVYGKYAIVTGGTAINGFKNRLKGGRVLSVILIAGLIAGQWISLSSILNITSNAVKEVLVLCIPSIPETGCHWIVIGVALFIAGTIWFILNKGNYSVFEKILSFLVTMMGLSFIISMFIELPDPGTIAKGLVPTIPPDSSLLFVAAFVGTTMSSPTFVMRPLIIKSKGWGRDDVRTQRRDAAVSSGLTFFISASIMICAAGVLFPKGLVVENVLDMIYVLQPLAGRFAVALFVVGLLSAGLSSIIPIMMLAPELVSDYSEGQMETGTRRFRILTGIAACFGMVIPILGAKPIIATIVAQVALVFVLPLVIGMMFFLINKKEVMGNDRPGLVMNALMVLAFIFSCGVSLTAVVELAKLFQ